MKKETKNEERKKKLLAICWHVPSLPVDTLCGLFRPPEEPVSENAIRRKSVTHYNEDDRKFQSIGSIRSLLWIWDWYVGKPSLVPLYCSNLCHQVAWSKVVTRNLDNT